MSLEKYSEYMDKLAKEPSEIARGWMLIRAARDGEITTAELVHLDNYCKRELNKKGRKHYGEQ